MIAPARLAAFDALCLIDGGRLDLGETLARTRDGLPDARDRALATDLVLGTLRWRGAIDHQLANLSGRTLATLDTQVLAALRLGAYQLLYLQRVPSSAIVNDSVALVKRARLHSASGFANAILRRLSRERAELRWPERPQPEDETAFNEFLSVVQSHPRWLVERWTRRYGVRSAEAWLTFNNQHPAMTLAVNRARFSRDEVMQRLSDEGIVTKPATHAPDGLVVIEGRPLASECFRSGAVIIQDEASQLIPHLVGVQTGDRVLDACAAPGGKTVALSAHVGLTGTVVASDVRARRMRLLRATLDRCAVSAHLVQIASTGALPFRNESFDRILIDAPCSGLGTLRRDPDIRWRRHPDDLEDLAASQHDLLDRVAPLVARGGRLVYSTCSSEPEENEQVVQAFVAEASEFTIVPLQSLDDVPSTVRTLAASDGFLRTDPARHELEAFFGAVLQRRP
jgi:16S rRNA (cytosine967-C5)-methyltransferase